MKVIFNFFFFFFLFGQHKCFSNIVLANKIKIPFVSSLSASVGVG